MPSLLQEGSKEVECHDDVLSDLLVVHFAVSNGDVKVGDLLKLPLDGSSDIIDLLLEWLTVGNWLWELTDSVKNWSELSNFLNEGAGGEKNSVLLGPLLDKFLVFVEFLESINGGNINIESSSLGLILMLLIGNHADLKVWSWDVDKSD